jgi:exosome complex component RRP46
MLALLSTSIPLETSLSSTIVSILPNNEVVTNPGSHAVARAASLHVFAFTGNGKLLLVESEGSFDMKQWKEAARLASQACVGTSESETMVSEQSTTPTSNVSLGSVFRQKLEDKIAQDSKWKTAAK